MEKIKTQPKLETEDYRLILTALAFFVGIDLNTITPDEKMESEILELMAKVKKLGFKRRPKLNLLDYSKSAKKDKEELLNAILKIVDVNVEE